MELLFELIFEFVGELFLQILFEGLAELGFHRLAKAYKKPKHPIISGAGYLILGATAGLLSLLIFPSSFIHTQSLKIISLFAMPIMLGGIMVLIQKLRENYGQAIVKLDRFIYGFLFAFGMSFVRFMWTN